MKPSDLWHTLSIDRVVECLSVTPAGLTHGEAVRRLAEHGPNELPSADRVTAWTILLGQLKNVLIVILLIATIISASLGHIGESVVILVIVSFAILLGFVQEFRAERAIEALRKMTAATAVVLRDGNESEIPARELVPGDVVLLRVGDKVPADGRVIESVNLQLIEASLTGESVPVAKQINPLAVEGLGLGDRNNMIYAGTVVTYGRGRAVVVGTGANTEFGKITRMLQKVELPRTPLQQNLDRVGKLLALAAIVVVLFIVVMGLMRGAPLLEMFIFGVALAVAAVPEALPAVITISLAIGVQRMVKRHALIRHLPAVETLGSTSVICSDKTGTLTRDEMTVRKVVVGGREIEVTGTGYEPVGTFRCDGAVIEPTGPLIELLRGAALASDAQLSQVEGYWKIKGDPTEGALIVAAAKAGLDKKELEKAWPRVDEIPFTSESKRMTTLHATSQGTVSYSKGAPEVIVETCSRQLAEEEESPLDKSAAEQIREAARTMAKDGLRVLAVAHKPDAQIDSAEHGMVFLGLVGMIDAPRAEVKSAVKTCEEAGIKPIMITGDHPATAEAVARELGLLKTGRVVTGDQINAISDAELEKEIHNIEVYARVSPEHKLRVVNAWQKNKYVVAMTGDGVNDAPALKKADVGVAMGITGTDVSKEAADMTLTDDNFASIVGAVEEGRMIFANIKKYLMYLLSSNIGEIGLVASATFAGLPLPLTAVQILYVNLATDGLPALALSVDPPQKDLMRQSPRDPRTGIFTRAVVMLMLVGGMWSMTVNFALFTWALGSGRVVEDAMTMVFVSLVLIQFFKAYNFRSDRYSILNRPFANRWLNLAILWEVALLMLIVYSPILQGAFGTYSLSMRDWAIIVTLAFTTVPVIELAKWAVRRGWFGQVV